ncbi:MAG TPA: tetratricopeptide repeat protein [Candidatus Polarisedimenticolaceae bacterium]|nr:tetratricopeptide repeat protein [Candidatus Polarisedimenticolaceae bacterium]
MMLLGALLFAFALDTGPSVWDDPTFQKQFLGSYGVQADIEPKISAAESEQLAGILPLMGSDPAAAATQLEALITPQTSAALDFTLGNLRFQLGDLEAAERHYTAALAKFPSFRRAHKNLGLIRARSGRLAEAIPALTRTIELGGGDALTYGLLGWAYNAGERWLSAESAFRTAMLLQPDVLDWTVGLAQSLLRQQRFGEAAALCETLVTQHADRADFWLMQAGAYVGLGQPLKAAENYEIVQRLGKATPSVLYTLGDIYVNASLWEPAARAYAAALAQDGGASVERPARCIEILAQRGAFAQARSVLDRLRETHGATLDEPSRTRLLKLEARIAVAEGAGGDAARVALEQVVDADPLDGEALMLLGQHCAKQGDTEQALIYYERASSLDGFEADAKVRQAQLLVGRERYRDAVPLLKRAQELKPRDEVARYLDQVERLARSR